MRKLLVALCSLPLSLAAQEAVGGKDSAAVMDEVVVTGVVAPTRIQDALSTYRVIGREQAQAQGAVTLAEALRTQLNIQLSDDAVLGTGLQLQGLRGDKVKILIDGLPVAGRENGQVDLGQLNLANVARIEVVQGPMSVVYGSDALGGVINLITRKPRTPWSIAAGAHYESVGRYNFDGSVSRRLGTRSMLILGGGRNFFKGWHFLDTSSLRQRLLLFKPKEQYLGNAAWNYAAPSGFQLQMASDAVRENITNKGEVYPQPFYGNAAYAFDEYYRNTRVNSRLNMEMPVGKSGRLQLQNGHSFYHRTRSSLRTDLVTMEQAVRPEPGLQDTTQFSEWTLRGAYASAVKAWRYTIGYDVNLQSGQSGKLQAGGASQKEYAAYAQLSRGFFREKLTVQGGLRGGYHTRYAPPVVPSFNALFRAGERTRLRASYARGFRAPSLKERYLEFVDNNHHIIGAEGLKAEASHHAQASFSWDAVQSEKSRLSLTATGFFNDITNGIALAATDPTNPLSIDYTYANLARQQNAIGTMQLAWSRGLLSGQVGYSMVRTFAQAGQYAAFNAQEATANAQAGWKSFVLSVFYKYTGEQPALVPAIDGSATFSGRLPAYHTLDASVNRKFLRERFQIIAGVKNIFDVQTITAAGAGPIGIHTGSGDLSMLPRRLFTTLRVTLGE